MYVYSRYIHNNSSKLQNRSMKNVKRHRRKYRKKERKKE